MIHSRFSGSLTYADVLSLTMTLFTVLSTAESTGLSTGTFLYRVSTRPVSEGPHTASEFEGASLQVRTPSFREDGQPATRPDCAANHEERNLFDSSHRSSKPRETIRRPRARSDRIVSRETLTARTAVSGVAWVGAGPRGQSLKPGV